MDHSNEAAAAALQDSGASRDVRAFVDDVVAQRSLTRYASTSSSYVALHRAGAPVALYVHPAYVDVAMDLPAADRLHALTGAQVVGKATLPYVRVDSERLHHAGHRALLLQAAVEGVDWTTHKTGKTPSTTPAASTASAASALGLAGVAPSSPSATCPECWTVPSANGTCSC